MFSIVDALNRWVLGSEEQDFLRTCDTGLKHIPHPIFLEALSRSLQRGYRLTPEDSYRSFEGGSDSESDTHSSSLPGGLNDEVIPLSSSRPGIPYDLVVVIFRYAGFHRPRSEDLIPFQEETHDVWSKGPLAMEDIAVSKPLTSVDLETLCALRIVTNSTHQGHVSFPERGSWSWFGLVIASPSSSSRPASPMLSGSGSFPDSSTSSSLTPTILTNRMVFNFSDPPRAPDTERDVIINNRKLLYDAKISIHAHTHPVDAGDTPTLHTSGNNFSLVHFYDSTTGEGHDMCTVAEVARPGDVLAVRAYAQYRGWWNNVQGVGIKAWVWYEPMF